MVLLVVEAGLAGENITIGFICGGNRTTRREHNDWFYLWRKQDYPENARRLVLLVEEAGVPGENITIGFIGGGSRTTRREHNDWFYWWRKQEYPERT